MKTTPITQSQWKKVLKALCYSLGSGFVGGFVLGLSGVLQAGTSDLNIIKGLETAAIVGGAVGSLNSLAVTIKQLFSEEN